MHEAKTRLSQLVKQVERGEDVVIARNGKPVARLTAAETAGPAKRRFARFRGKIHIPDNFSDPDPEIEALFYGDPD